jgi:hypothetical protein
VLSTFVASATAAFFFEESVFEAWRVSVPFLAAESAAALATFAVSVGA